MNKIMTDPTSWKLNPRIAAQEQSKRSLYTKFLCWVFDLLVKRNVLVNSTYDHHTETVHTLIVDSLLQAIHEQCREIIRSYNLSGRTILIGSKQYMQIMGELNEVNQRVSLSFDAKEKRIFGLTVEIIPWIDGLLVMP